MTLTFRHLRRMWSYEHAGLDALSIIYHPMSSAARYYLLIMAHLLALILRVVS